jgi:hypothetical protein
MKQSDMKQPRSFKFVTFPDQEKTIPQRIQFMVDAATHGYGYRNFIIAFLEFGAVAAIIPIPQPLMRTYRTLPPEQRVRNIVELAHIVIDDLVMLSGPAPACSDNICHAELFDEKAGYVSDYFSDSLDNPILLH